MSASSSANPAAATLPDQEDPSAAQSARRGRPVRRPKRFAPGSSADVGSDGEPVAPSEGSSITAVKREEPEDAATAMSSSSSVAADADVRGARGSAPKRRRKNDSSAQDAPHPEVPAPAPAPLASASSSAAVPHVLPASSSSAMMTEPPTSNRPLSSLVSLAGAQHAAVAAASTATNTATLPASSSTGTPPVPPPRKVGRPRVRTAASSAAAAAAAAAGVSSNSAEGSSEMAAAAAASPPADPSSSAVATPAAAAAPAPAAAAANSNQHHAPPAFLQPPKKYRRRGTPPLRMSEKGFAKGLRHFSLRVCKAVETHGVTKYKDVAAEMIRELSQASSGGKDHKNIRRRVYDALNVLISVDIIAKQNDKTIKWVGLPANTTLSLQSIAAENAMIKSRLQQQKEMFLEYLRQRIYFLKLIERNKQQLTGGAAGAAATTTPTAVLPSTGSSPLSSLALPSTQQQQQQQPMIPTAASSEVCVPLPFILVNTHPKTVIDCEMAEDRSEIFFNFSDSFEIHDDNDVVGRMAWSQLTVERVLAEIPAPVRALFHPSELRSFVLFHSAYLPTPTHHHNSHNSHYHHHPSSSSLPSSQQSSSSSQPR